MWICTRKGGREERGKERGRENGRELRKIRICICRFLSMYVWSDPLPTHLEQIVIALSHMEDNVSIT